MSILLLLLLLLFSSLRSHFIPFIYSYFYSILSLKGEIRLQKDIEALLRVGTKGFELLPRTEPCELKVRFSPFLQDVSMHVIESVLLPCDFLIIVDKFYPHDRPIVKCLDPGYNCIHIDDDGTLIHYDLADNWSPICALGDIVKSIQNVRLFLYKLQSQYRGENAVVEAQFDTTSIDVTSMRERLAVEALAVAFVDEQGNMVVDSSDSFSDEMIPDEDFQSETQRSIVGMTETTVQSVSSVVDFDGSVSIDGMVTDENDV